MLNANADSICVSLIRVIIYPIIGSFPEAAPTHPIVGSIAAGPYKP